MAEPTTVGRSIASSTPPVGRCVGVIGGSGLYDLPALTERREHRVETTFGMPSDAVMEGRLGDTRLLFLPRHGRGHRLPPHEINYRANVLALKQLGAEQIVSVSAVGSLREDHAPGDVVIVDQFIDRTRMRPSSFFEGIGVVAHVSFADPIDGALSRALGAAAREAGATVHAHGTYLCMEGPQFSTRAESRLYQSWGASVIGMTNLPEAKLAREAQLPYATLALVTDYDAWRVEEEGVSVADVIAVLHRNVDLARRILALLAKRLPDPALSPATHALEHAVLTPPASIDAAARTKLAHVLPSSPS
jgi:5'-methylthioadenosine phosphorylase